MELKWKKKGELEIPLLSNSITKKRLEKVYKNASILSYDSNSKFIIMSDCHRGQGNAGDNFLPNQILYYGALEYYLQNGFTYIELGDGDELWENRRMKPIVEVHSDAFWMLSNFYKDNRLYMLYGNHDIIKKRKGYMSRHCNSYYCENTKQDIPLLEGIDVLEGLILENSQRKERIFLVHGHQGDFLNDTIWPVARFLVRYVWRKVELIGFLDPTGAGRPYKRKEKIEKRIASFSKEINQIVIAGHTHRPVFPMPKEGLYFNDGSCVHPRCITGIEIEKNQISLIKWSVCIKEDRGLYVGREVLEGPVCITDYFLKK